MRFVNQSVLVLVFCLISKLAAAGGLPTSIEIIDDRADPSQANVGFVVTIALTADGVPTGTVEVSDGESSCMVVLPETSCLFKTSAQGTRLMLTASYSGDATFAPSQSDPEPHQIAPAGFPERISVGDGGLLRGISLLPTDSEMGDISGDGRFVVFTANEPLTPDDRNEFKDVFLFDRVTGRTELISQSVDGLGLNGDAQSPSISDDGRWVSYETLADNVIANDNNGDRDVFLVDRTQGTTIRISEVAGVGGDSSSDDAQVSDDGQWVVFSSTATNFPGAGGFVQQVFLYNVALQSLTLVSLNSMGQAGNGGSFNPVISDDGSRVGFISGATDLVPNDINNQFDGFVVDLMMNTTTRISVDENGGPLDTSTFGLRISGNGGFAFFSSFDADVVANDTNGVQDWFRYDMASGAVARVTLNQNGQELDDQSTDLSTSTSGQVIAFATFSSNADGANDTNNAADIFVRNLQTGAVTRVSLDQSGALTDGGQSRDPRISADGNVVAFASESNITGLRNSADQPYLHDLSSGEIVWMAPFPIGEESNGDVQGGRRFSLGGNSVIFSGGGLSLSELFIDQSGARRDQIFLRDRQAPNTELVVQLPGGVQTPRSLSGSEITPDGRFVVFSSTSSGLNPDIPQLVFDNIFLLDRQTGVIEWLSRGLNDAQPDQSSFSPAISDDGVWVSWLSLADNLTADDGNGRFDVFLLNRTTDALIRVSQSTEGNGHTGFTFAQLMAGDGSTITFLSENSLVADDTNNSMDTYAYNIATQTFERASLSDMGVQAPSGFAAAGDVSDDGRFVLFNSSSDIFTADDNNGQSDLFLRDRLMQTTTLVSQATDGTQSDQRVNEGCLSGNGRFAAFIADDDFSTFTGFDSVLYVRDIQAGQTAVLARRVDGDPADGVFPASSCFSPDAHLVVVESRDRNLILGKTLSVRDNFVLINPLMNNAPVAQNDSYTILEDDVLPIESQDANDLLDNDSDSDNDPIHIQNSQLLTMLNGIQGPLAVEANGSLVFAPAADENGVGTVMYTITDSVATSDAQITVNVTPVNDQPTLTLPNPIVIARPGEGKVTIPGWAVFDPGAANENDQQPIYLVSNVSDPTHLAIAPQVGVNGDLIFQFAMDATDSVTFDLQVRDDGGTDNGGVDTSVTVSATLQFLGEDIFGNGFESQP